MRSTEDNALAYIEMYEERAAIMEHDGGCSRWEAEAAALSDMRDAWTQELYGHCAWWQIEACIKRTPSPPRRR